MVEFRKVIFPGGETFPIRAQAFDVSIFMNQIKSEIRLMTGANATESLRSGQNLGASVSS